MDLKKVRDRFSAELADLYTDPDFPVSKHEIAQLTDFIHNKNLKLQANRILTDKLAHICNDFRISNFKDIRTIYEAILVGWERYCVWAGP